MADSDAHDACGCEICEDARLLANLLPSFAPTKPVHVILTADDNPPAFDGDPFVKSGRERLTC
jgi:hypothetical protein